MRCPQALVCSIGIGRLIFDANSWYRLYFDSDSSRTFVHAMRRGWFTSICFVIIQFPLAASTIVLSSALQVAVQQETFPPNLKWFLAGGSSASVTLIAISGSLHKGLDLPNSGMLPRSVRLGLRYLVGEHADVQMPSAPSDQSRCSCSIGVRPVLSAIHDNRPSDCS
jgi:hypothetical protein